LVINQGKERNLQQIEERYKEKSKACGGKKGIMKAIKWKKG
jgi:hypothetical protein